MPIYKLTLNAGQNLPQQIGGRYFQFIEGPAPIRVRLFGGSFSEFWVGTGTQSPEAFPSLELENPETYAVTVFIWVDENEWIDRRRNQIEAATDLIPVADVAGVYVGGALLANAALDLSGAAPDGYVRRKAVQVANLDPAVNLLLQDAAGRTGFVVRPGDSITQPVSGFLRIKNDQATPVACAISEIFWRP